MKIILPPFFNCDELKIKTNFNKNSVLKKKYIKVSDVLMFLLILEQLSVDRTVKMNFKLWWSLSKFT